MASSFRKEIKELWGVKGHLNNPPPPTDDLYENFARLQELSQRTNAGFRIEGDPLHFSIKSSFTTAFDRLTQTLQIEANNFIERFIWPLKQIAISDIEGIIVKNVGGSVNWGNRISVLTKTGSKTIIATLADGPIYYVNHEVFISSFSKLIGLTSK